MDRQFIKIAEHFIEVDGRIILPFNFNPFKVGAEDIGSVISRVMIGEVDSYIDTDKCKEKSSLDVAEDLFLCKNDDGSYSAAVNVHSSGKMYFMHALPDWKVVTLSADCISKGCPSSVIDKFLMLTFIYASSFYKTVLMHASCIRIGMDAVAFIGHSGVGKSTHSRLWLEHIGNTELINDDQPAVRVSDNKVVRIYGTPWSGKTPCYKDVCANLRGIVSMKQAKENRIVPLSSLQLLVELFPSCSMMKSDGLTFRNIVSTMVEISSSVSGFVLENRPEAEAAMMVYNHTIGNGAREKGAREK